MKITQKTVCDINYILYRSKIATYATQKDTYVFTSNYYFIHMPGIYTGS